MNREYDGFEQGRHPDSDEAESHLQPSNRNRHIEAPTGRWIDVPDGMVAAPGTYVDDHGVLRSVSDDSCVVWHRPGCTVRGIRPDEIIYNANGAPWCPRCATEIAQEQAEKAAKAAINEAEEIVRERLRGIFGA